MGKLILAVLLVASQAHAASTGVVPISFWSASAGYDSGEITAAGGPVTFQLCGGHGGNAFGGSFTIYQGMKSGYLAETYSSGPIEVDGCKAIALVPLPIETRIVRVIITMDNGGRHSSWLYWSQRATQ